MEREKENKQNTSRGIRQIWKSLRVRNQRKRLMRNSPMETMPVSNGSEADVSESIVDNANASGLASTTDGE